jgi:riboflavin transporter
LHYQRKFFTPRRVARMSIFIALSAVGALTKIPSPTGTVALDSSIGYFAAAAFGYWEGALIASIGHLLTSFTIGFPLGLPVHLYIALQMALWAIVFRYCTVRIHPVAGIIVGTILNGFGSAYLMIPIGGYGLAAALVLPLTIGSFANIIIAAMAYSIVKKSNIV